MSDFVMLDLNYPDTNRRSRGISEPTNVASYAYFELPSSAWGEGRHAQTHPRNELKLEGRIVAMDCSARQEMFESQDAMLTAFRD